MNEEGDEWEKLNRSIHGALNLGEKWRKECLDNTFPLPTLF